MLAVLPLTVVVREVIDDALALSPLARAVCSVTMFAALVAMEVSCRLTHGVTFHRLTTLPLPVSSHTSPAASPYGVVDGENVTTFETATALTAAVEQMPANLSAIDVVAST